ncbi:MAG: transmembrane anchor protein [Donghicola eburneus]|nr:transmembrane anchor protein [Donghicola eburneus]MCI5038105.1 transmembrane anchor protein [Donghicola eburneus]
MFNSKRPSLEELPSSAQLLQSTAIAAASAIAILVTVVLPAEYNIDPTGVGGMLGLAEMGEIKQQLAAEAEADRQMDAGIEEQSSLLDDIFGLFAGSAAAQDAVAEEWRDEISFTLVSGEHPEWKLSMTEGQKVFHRMTVTGGRVNFDMHGHGNGANATYEKARGSTGSEGPLVAQFDGDHGWFWRNRDNADVTVILQLRGEYQELKDET